MSKRFTLRYFTLFAALLLLHAAPTLAQQSGDDASGAQLIQFNPAQGLRAEDAPASLFTKLELKQGTDELRSEFVEQPGDGFRVERLHQYYKGIRVAHGSMGISSKNGLASFAFGKIYHQHASNSIIPQLSEGEALTAALAATGAKHYAWEGDPAAYPKGSLTLVEDFSGDKPDGILHLAYAFDIYATQPLSRAMVYVDAVSGKLLLSDAILKHVAGSGKSLYSDTVQMQVGKIGSLFYLHDSTRGNGVFTYNLQGGTSKSSAAQISSSTSFFAGSNPGVDAHWGAQKVYDYWKLTHNRSSWNGSNAPLNSYVSYSTAYDNAFWDGSAMNYGNGSGGSGGLSPLVALDVCAHEIGHGVCQSTAQLVYNSESGAMNEGFSDIWGAVIEAYGDPHEADTRAKDYWLIGEELSSSPFRSMRDPKRFGNPDTYQGDYWTYAGSGCTSSTGDNCGVHNNSGVLNHWFYLLCTGGKGTNDHGAQYQLKGIGMLKGAKIAYATELLLNSTGTYANARTLSISSASTL